MLSCAAAPSGVVTKDTFEIFANQITNAIGDNKHNLDGILLSLHGAMVVEGYDDGEGELLRRIRAIIGHRPTSAANTANTANTANADNISADHFNTVKAMGSFADMSPDTYAALLNFIFVLNKFYAFP